MFRRDAKTDKRDACSTHLEGKNNRRSPRLDVAFIEIFGNINPLMRIEVHFYSYCKELTGCPAVSENLEPGSRIADLLQKLFVRFPKLLPAQKSLLVAVGVDYQGADYVLTDGDEVSLFPPVQGG
jgi:molybdopterin converting factor small subunit